MHFRQRIELDELSGCWMVWTKLGAIKQYRGVHFPIERTSQYISFRGELPVLEEAKKLIEQRIAEIKERGGT